MFIRANYEVENGVQTNQANHIKYVPKGTIAYLKHIDNSIRQCKLVDVVGYCTTDGSFSIRYIWKVAGERGLFDTSNIHNIGSLQPTMEKAKTTIPTACSKFPERSGKWYFADDLLKMGFINGHSIYKVGLNGYHCKLYKIEDSGKVITIDAITEQSVSCILVYFPSDGGKVVCKWNDKTSIKERLGKELFFTEQDAIDSYHPEYVALEDDEEEEEKKPATTISNEIRVETPYGIAILNSVYDYDKDASLYHVYDADHNHLGEIDDVPFSQMMDEVEELMMRNM